MQTARAVVIGALSLLSAPQGARAQPVPGAYYGDHMQGGWLGWILGPLMMVVLVAGAVALVVVLVRWLGGSAREPSAPPPAGKSALEILEERYARGEIDREEFEERRRVLGGR